MTNNEYKSRARTDSARAGAATRNARRYARMAAGAYACAHQWVKMTRWLEKLGPVAWLPGATPADCEGAAHAQIALGDFYLHRSANETAEALAWRESAARWRAMTA